MDNKHKIQNYGNYDEEEPELKVENDILDMHEPDKIIYEIVDF